MGVLATRSPHRPCPIGLSVAKVIAVEQGGCRIVLGGADIVDGTPVLDIKPYAPFCDSVPGATAPAWVAEEAEASPGPVSRPSRFACGKAHELPLLVSRTSP